MATRAGDDFARHFQARLAQLGEPVLREVLDPLVLEAKDYSASHADGGVTVVGATESTLLRASANRKYPLYLFVDALCRSRTEFPFRAQFSRNLEHIFPHMVMEADDNGRTKLLRLLNIWREKGSFDKTLLDRIRARCDPAYRGPPLESLPQPVMEPIYAPQPVQRQPIQPLLPSQSKPQLQQRTVDQSALFQRAAEILNRMYDQMRTLPMQRLPLDVIYRTNNALYNQIMGTAHSELLYGPPPPILPSTVPVAAPPAYAPAPVQPLMHSTAPMTAPVNATMPASQSATSQPTVITKLSTQTLLERTYVPMFVTQLLENGSTLPKKPVQEADSNTVFVRSWMDSESDWVKGSTKPRYQAVKLFATFAGGSKSSPVTPETNSSNVLDDSVACVPKDDSQPRCALSGEEFETFWSEEEQAWMYKGAVRPDPNGPIYKVHAWRAHQRGAHQKMAADIALPELDADHPSKRFRMAAV